MKLLLVLAAVLALTLAEEEKREIHNIEDSLAEASNVESSKDGADLLKSASNYVPPNFVDQQYVNVQHPVQQVNNWVQPAKPEVQNDYYWVTPGNHHHHTTQVPVIKNEMYYGDHGDYKYEYKTADGTHVGEQGWFTDPKQSDESLVKKGWYSFVGADGVTYTVTYWADHTGYHAYGSHLPAPNRPYYTTQAPYPVQVTTQRPVYPPKPIYTTARPTYTTVRPTYTTARPTYTVKPIYTYPTQQPTYYPNQQQIYYPQQPTYNQQPHHYNQQYNV